MLKLKRALSILVAVVILSFSFCVTSASATELTLEEYLVQQIDLMGREKFTVIDCRNYLNSYDSIQAYAKAVTDTVNSIFSKHKEFFYCKYNSADGNGFIKMSYISEDTDKLFKEYADLLKFGEDFKLTVDSSLSGYDKALYLHDWIILNTDKNEKSGELITDCLLYGNGNSRAYANAYYYLANLIDLECVVVNDISNYYWNAIKLGSNWYYVDTFMDENAIDGRISHNGFLMTNDDISDSYTRWQDSFKNVSLANNKAYSNDNIKKATTAVNILENGYMYMNSDGALCLYNPTSGALDTKYTVTEKWKSFTATGGEYVPNYSALVGAGDYSVFTTPDKIIVSDKDGNCTVLHTLNASKGNIYGVRYNDGIVTVSLKTFPNDSNETLINIPVKVGTILELDRQLSDINGNGFIDAGDFNLLSSHIVNKYTLDSKEFFASDFNNDGIVNSSDALELKKIILGLE